MSYNYAGKMMKKQYILILILVIFTLILFGCNSQINPDNSLASISPSATSNETLVWMELQGRFYTKDLARAQKEIPFTIILPTYLPDNKHEVYLPDIDGPLSELRNDNEIEVNIKYGFNLGHELPGIIIITESNYISSLGDPELNPELEQVEIQGISVRKTKDDWSPGSDAYYSFNSKNIYYVVETHNLPNEESNKIIESMIAQLD
jgi:hypothetical protein